MFAWPVRASHSRLCGVRWWPTEAEFERSRPALVVCCLLFIAVSVTAWFFRKPVLLWAWQLAPVLPGDKYWARSMTLYNAYASQSAACAVLLLSAPGTLALVTSLAGQRPAVSMRTTGCCVTGVAVVALMVWSGWHLMPGYATNFEQRDLLWDSWSRWYWATLLYGMSALAVPVQAPIVAGYFPDLWRRAERMPLLWLVLLSSPVVAHLTLFDVERSTQLLVAGAVICLALLAIAVARLARRHAPN